MATREGACCPIDEVSAATGSTMADQAKLISRAQPTVRGLLLAR